MTKLPAAAIAHPTGDVLFAVPNKATLFRVRTFWTKEPDTVAWLGEMNPGDVFVDVGANIGLYAIWAAKTRGVRAFAFEPESQNFAALNQNIALNGTDMYVVAYPVALSDGEGYGPLHLSAFGIGGSCHAYGEATNFKGGTLEPVFVQGSVGARLDRLIEQRIVPSPDYIKIDVDGFEHRVVHGAVRAIKGAQSVLIEINTNMPEHRELVVTMENLGFRYAPEQVAAAQRTEGPFKGVGNYIFRR